MSNFSLFLIIYLEYLNRLYLCMMSSYDVNYISLFNDSPNFFFHNNQLINIL